VIRRLAESWLAVGGPALFRSPFCATDLISEFWGTEGHAVSLAALVAEWLDRALPLVGGVLAWPRGYGGAWAHGGRTPDGRLRCFFEMRRLGLRASGGLVAGLSRRPVIDGGHVPFLEALQRWPGPVVRKQRSPW